MIIIGLFLSSTVRDRRLHAPYIISYRNSRMPSNSISSFLWQTLPRVGSETKPERHSEVTGHTVIFRIPEESTAEKNCHLVMNSLCHVRC